MNYFALDTKLEAFKNASTSIDVDQFQGDDKLEYYKVTSLWYMGWVVQQLKKCFRLSANLGTICHPFLLLIWGSWQGPRNILDGFRVENMINARW